MVKLAELKTIDDHLKLPEVASNEIDWNGQWVDDEYDGKWLRGVLIYRDKSYWCQAFDSFDEAKDEYKSVMKYVIVELTSEQIAEFESLQSHWREVRAEQTAGFENLSRHWHLPEIGADVKGYIKAMEERNKPVKDFFDLHSPSLERLRSEIQNNDAIGWFERDALD